MDKNWNRCEVCGRFISYADIADGTAIHELLHPDQYYSDGSSTGEVYETLCPLHIETKTWRWRDIVS